MKYASASTPDWERQEWQREEALAIDSQRRETYCERAVSAGPKSQAVQVEHVLMMRCSEKRSLLRRLHKELKEVEAGIRLTKEDLARDEGMLEEHRVGMRKEGWRE